jgi:predicted TIM-barrel fold metal-dependent hydrolase
MRKVNRRQLLEGVGAAWVAGKVARAHPGVRADSQDSPKGKRPLDLTEFQPKSMLHVRETRISRSSFPVIDIHTHLSFARDRGESSQGGKVHFLAEPHEVLEVMDRKNLRMMVDLTGGFGEALEETIRKYQTPYPGRFLVFTEPHWSRLNEPGYSQSQADEIRRAAQTGARGLKLTKTLGLYLREGITTGPLVKVDDRRFDPMWEACGALRMPVAIHVADPEAFFLPIDRFNERFEELNNHPDWSFYDKDFPSFQELIEAFNRVVARHPKTQFIAVHFGHNAENLASVSARLDRYPNMHVDLAARIGELGRQPRAARRFFDRHQDRILFGTDAVPHGVETPQQIFRDELYEIYFRFLETEDEYFDYAPAPIPPQGRWRIYGLGLPAEILRKVYFANAERLLGIRV